MKKQLAHRFAISVMLILLTASIGWAAMGEVRNFTFLGTGPRDTSNQSTTPDALFSLNISGTAGALTGLHLQYENGQSSWDTTADNSIPGMRVQDSGGTVIAENNEGMPLTPFLLGMNLTLTVPDDGFVAKGGEFTVTAHFVDGSESRSTLSIPASAATPSPTASQVEILYARMTGKGTRDLTGRNKRLRGDGTPDYGLQVVLQGTGTITAVAVRSVQGDSAKWDTHPDSDSWLVAVLQSGKTLNRPDGSIEAQIQGKSTLDLLVTDNGAIANGRSNFEVSFAFSDGTSISKTITTEAAAVDSDGTFSGSAILTGSGTRDLVGKSENMGGNGVNDWRVDLRVNTPGTIKGMKIDNISGSAGQWDTLPGSGRWAVAVTERNGNLLNQRDGSLVLAISKETDIELWIEDNGSLSDNNTRSRLTLIYDDGRELTGDIIRRVVTDQPKEQPVQQSGGREIRFSGPRQASSSDYVGARKRLGKNGTNDWLFEFSIEGKGTITEVAIENIGSFDGAWDTDPGSRFWGLAVVIPGKGGKGVLNKRDGSVSFNVPPNRNLQLFIEDNGSLQQGASNFKISVTWSDGTVTTATS